MLIGARGEYMFTAAQGKGLMISAFLGATFGEIQAQPPAGGSTEGAPWVRSGLFGAHVGANVRYRFTPNFGVFVRAGARLAAADGAVQHRPHARRLEAAF